jgi:hypothetical protein
MAEIRSGNEWIPPEPARWLSKSRGYGWRDGLDERENDFRSLADTMNRFEKALAESEHSGRIVRPSLVNVS